jgi:putative lipase involved disintegration of autophagic bodies
MKLANGSSSRVLRVISIGSNRSDSTLNTDATGFVATDTTNSLIVISFRGSRSLRNWIANLNFPTTTTTICSNCKAAKGFWSSWLEAQDGVLKAVATARAQHPNFKVVAVGHSLGGALSSLAAGVLRSQGVNVDLVRLLAIRKEKKES